jgi:Undecaprenyl-phosphate glucose phosphotransferase
MAVVATASARPEPGPPSEANPADRRGPFRPERLAPVRERMSGALLARIFRTIDVALALAVALAVAYSASAESLLSLPLGAILPMIGGQIVTLWGLSALSAYRLGRRETLATQAARVGLACLAGLAASLFVSALVHTPAVAGLSLFGVTLVALLAAHAAALLAVRRWRRLGRLTPNIVVVGATANASRLIQTALSTREVNVLGIFDDRLQRAPPNLEGVPVLGDTSALLEHAIIPYIDRVVITVTSSAQARVRELIERLRTLPNAVTLSIDIEGHDTRQATLSRMADAPLTLVSGIQEDERRAFHKRVQDLVLGLTALVLAAPFMLAIAIAIRLDSPGPIIFRQRREGFNNETITVFKFRSMRTEASDFNASRQVEKNDERVTRIGRFIRRTSLDELPQILNVLRGEMSLVGPRPHSAKMITAGEESRRLVAEYSWRHRMKPGITGWAQIHGSRGPVTTREEIRRRVVLDVEYIERQSFALDLYIMLMTLPSLLGDKDVVR